MVNGRISIVLVNTYDRLRFTEAHRRALVRAGPVCRAFGMNLAFMDFPFEKLDKELDSPDRIVEYLTERSSIGRGGEYLRSLAADGKVLVVPDFGKFPSQLGTLVATTSKPDPARAVDIPGTAELVSGGKPLSLVFGLGPRGLPRKIIDSMPHHLDLTMDNVSFETCTALGAVPAMLHTFMRFNSSDGKVSRWPKDRV